MGTIDYQAHSLEELVNEQAPEATTPVEEITEEIVAETEELNTPSTVEE